MTIAMGVDRFTGVCLDDQLLKFSIEIDVAANKARYQNVRCASACRRVEIDAPPLDGVSRAIRRLKFPPPPDVSGTRTVTDHEEHIYLTLRWGDGRSVRDSRDGGRAPIDSWIAYELLLGLEPPAWEAQAKTVDCRQLEWPKW